MCAKFHAISSPLEPSRDLNRHTACNRNGMELVLSVSILTQFRCCCMVLQPLCLCSGLDCDVLGLLLSCAYMVEWLALFCLIYL